MPLLGYFCCCVYNSRNKRDTASHTSLLYLSYQALQITCWDQLPSYSRCRNTLKVWQLDIKGVMALFSLFDNCSVILTTALARGLPPQSNLEISAWQVRCHALRSPSSFIYRVMVVFSYFDWSSVPIPTHTWPVILITAPAGRLLPASNLYNSTWHVRWRTLRCCIYFISRFMAFFVISIIESWHFWSVMLLFQ